MIIMPHTLLMERAQQRAYKDFDKDGGLNPIMLGINATDPEPRVWELPDNAKNSSNKNAMGLYFKLLLHNHRATACCFLHEAWALNVDGLELEEAREAIEWCDMHGVRNHPRRYECVNYVVEDREHCWNFQQGIIRPHGGKPTLDVMHCSFSSEGPADEVVGRFANWLHLSERELEIGQRLLFLAKLMEMARRP